MKFTAVGFKLWIKLVKVYILSFVGTEYTWNIENSFPIN